MENPLNLPLNQDIPAEEQVIYIEKGMEYIKQVGATGIVYMHHAFACPCESGNKYCRKCQANTPNIFNICIILAPMIHNLLKEGAKNKPTPWYPFGAPSQCWGRCPLIDKVSPDEKGLPWQPSHDPNGKQPECCKERCPVKKEG